MQYLHEEPLLPGERRALAREASVMEEFQRQVEQQASQVGLAAVGQQYVPRSTPMEIHWQFARTELANERTFLAWVRTALSMFSIGFGILKVEKAGKPDDLEWYDAGIGFLFLFSALLCVYAGVQRYYAVDKGLNDSIGVTKNFDRINIGTVIVTIGVVFLASTLRTVVCLIA